MTVQFFAADPLDVEIDRVLHLLARRVTGEPIGKLEGRRVDLKEDASRRDARTGATLPGDVESDAVARALQSDVACMANSVDGGALIVGARDDGTLVGTRLHAEWLRHRLWQLCRERHQVTIREVTVAGVPLLVLRVPESFEPVPALDGRVRWRVDDHCVEVPTSEWYAGRMPRLGYDWSAQASPHPAADARATSVQVARDYLVEAGDAGTAELAKASTEDLLRRLNVITPDGFLTNAGALVFVGRTTPALDYIRRNVTAGDSVLRINDPGRGLIEELHEVERAIAVNNPTEHIQRGFVIGQLTALPPKAAREAIVNGLAHRDWNATDATSIEHIGFTLVVMSPGGFIGGVNAGNIITHPSQSRNKALTELLAALRVAERQGVGVDRMVRDMIRVGLEPPTIADDGFMVRCVLVGGRVDREWLDFLAAIEPREIAEDLDSLLLLRHLVNNAWVDVETAAPILQRDRGEASQRLAQLAVARVRGERSEGQPVIRMVDGVPEDMEPAWCLSRSSVAQLGKRGRALGTAKGRPRVAATWARARRRISTTELASMTDVSPQHAGATLKNLEANGVLEPGRKTRQGRGFFYVPVDLDGTPSRQLGRLD